jgi:hypothetical protein
LTKLEWEASKTLAGDLVRQKDSDVIKCQAQGMMVDSVTLELLEIRSELDNLDQPIVQPPASLRTFCMTTSEGSTPPPSPRPLDQDEGSGCDSEDTSDSLATMEGFGTDGNEPCSSAE